MQTWSITLHGPAGVISTVDTGESQFVVGTGTASDVFTVNGDGVAERHAWVWISDAGLQVEDLGGGTLVNGYQINERVQVEYPASVQVGELTLVIEVKAVQPVAVSPTPSSMDITISQRAVTKSKASMEVTIPQRMPTRSNVQKAASTGTPSAQPSSADEASTHCKYTLVREIARGGMGQIYFGEDPQLKRHVAVKVSSVSEAGEDPRFSKEAEVLAQLAHPNIVPIYNIGVDAQRRPFYSMKLIKGRTLQAVLNLIRDGDATAIKDYPRATLLTIFRKVCDAMMFAHSKGILHRDLKPENIMVGEYGEVLVMDWGLAKVLGEREDNVSAVSKVNDTGDYGMTMEGEVMGTPQYMSPEQAMGMVAELDVRSDIYSLGGILYAILTLRPPIEGSTLDEVLTKVREGNISSMITKRGAKGSVTVGVPAAMGVGVPDALQAVTLRAMATDRNKRYANIEAFAADIEAYQNGFATQAEDAGTLRKFLLFVKRNKVVSALAAVIIVGAGLFMVRLAASERVALANAEEASKNAQRALEQKEVSRREAARTQLALAEASEREADAIQMRSALNAVPNDLRDPTWRYMSDRLDKSDHEIFPAKGRTWLGLENLPGDSDLMLALDSSGEVSSVDLRSGELKPLWQSSSTNGSASRFCISKDGSVAAVSFIKGKEGIVKVHRVADGVPLGEANQTNALARIWTSDTVVIGLGGHSIAAWDATSGEILWERAYSWSDGVTVDFSVDQKKLYLLTPKGQLETVEPKTGKVLSTSENIMAAIHTNCAESGGIFSDGARVVSTDINNPKHALRMWVNGSFKFAVPTPGQGSLFLSLLPKHALVVGLCPGFGPSGVIEFRDWHNGYLVSQIPVIFNAPLGFTGCAVRCKGDSVAVKLPEKIRVWTLQPSVPLAVANAPSNWAAEVQGFGNDPKILASTTNQNPLTSCVVLSELAADGKSVREISRCEFEGFGDRRRPDIRADPQGRRFVAWIDGKATGFRIDESGIHQLWKVKGVGGSVVLHPTLDLLWTGLSLIDFATGQEKQKIKSNGFRKGSFRTNKNDGIWIGPDRVLQIGYWGTAVSDSDENPEAGLNKSLVLWDATTGESCHSVLAPKAAALCVSPNGAMFAEAGDDKRVRIRDARTLAVIQEFRVHDSAVSDVAWHPTLPMLVTYSWDDKKIRIWDLTNYRMVEEFRCYDEKGRMSISPNGKRLIVSYRKTFVFEPKSFEGR